MRSKSFGNVVEVLNAHFWAFRPVIRKQGRHGGGTWVCKELVYKYAMWVNPEFEVKVTIVRAVLYWVGDLLLKAVDVAEKSGGKGQEKMEVALDYLRNQATDSLKTATESKLRTLVEEQLDRLQ